MGTAGTNHNAQNSKFHLFGSLILIFGISLEFGAWNLRFLNASILQDSISKDYLSIEYRTVTFQVLPGFAWVTLNLVVNPKDALTE